MYTISSIVLNNKDLLCWFSVSTPNYLPIISKWDYDSLKLVNLKHPTYLIWTRWSNSEKC